jgi:hypothetical protein
MAVPHMRQSHRCSQTERRETGKMKGSNPLTHQIKPMEQRPYSGRSATLARPLDGQGWKPS